MTLTTDYSPAAAANVETVKNNLCTQTVKALQNAGSDPVKLATVVQDFFNQATAADMTLDDIENILGVNEDCIMDLAGLEEADEEIVISAFEALTNNP